MSQKRQRKNRGLASHEPPPHEPASATKLHDLGGELRESFEGIITACALVEQMERAADDDAATDEELEATEGAVGGLRLTARIMAIELLARALDRPPVRRIAPVDDPPGEVADDDEPFVLDRLVRSLLSDSNQSPPPSRADRDNAIDEAAFLIREVGLEEFDALCDIVIGETGEDELFTHPVSAESAHVLLLEFVYSRAEAGMLTMEPLLLSEWDASVFEFSRYSVAPPGRANTEEARYARRVREHEYVLADRTTITLGRTVMEDLATEESFAEVFPRQHRMATALSASFVDVFECTAIDGTTVTLRSVRDETTYTIHEDLDPIEYSVGWTAAGRLIPFDGGHLRTEGMIFSPPGKPDVARVAEIMNQLEETLPPALAVEAFISSAIFGVKVPREIKPARSRADARDVLIALSETIADSGIDGLVADTDATLGGYIAALGAQADPAMARATSTSPLTRRTRKRMPRRRGL
ncbi:MAG TPA: hypothetical protein VM076_07385 [Gemmatimonadaceae bacterium]|nr:hypothetical protein [Gemmatimonadaceae bacterium]